MCSSKSKPQRVTPKIAQINGHQVLHPTSNQVPSLEGHNSLKKNVASQSPKTLALQPLTVMPTTNNKNNKNIKTKSSSSPPISPKLKSPRPPALKRGKDHVDKLNSNAEKIMVPRCTTKLKKPKSASGVAVAPSYDSPLIVEALGSIAATRREQVTIMQEQKKIRIAQYGRTKSAKYQGSKLLGLDSSVTTTINGPGEKRCCLITRDSDPIYVAYHDEEWGVSVHDDKLLFELLVLTGAQVGSYWTSVLKKRRTFREVFAGFDAEVITKFTEKRITSISADCGIGLSQVRGVVDNSKRILEVKKEFGSFDKYLWRFVSRKPINTKYRSCHKIPAKTSKSETMSKDMVKRGFRFVGPTVMHSFMQAAGLTNDHLITCPRHLQCIALESHQTTVGPGLWTDKS